MRATWKVPKGGTTGLSMSVEVFSPALENRREEGRALSMTVQLWNCKVEQTEGGGAGAKHDCGSF